MCDFLREGNMENSPTRPTKGSSRADVSKGQTGVVEIPFSIHKSWLALRFHVSKFPHGGYPHSSTVSTHQNVRATTPETLALECGTSFVLDGFVLEHRVAAPYCAGNLSGLGTAGAQMRCQDQGVLRRGQR